MSTTTDQTGSLNAALAHTEHLLKVDPKLAAEQAREILKSAPACPPALLLLAAAHRLSGDLTRALQLIDPLIDEQPNWTAAHFEYALALAGVGRGDEAIQALRQTVKLKPDHLEAWRVLGDHLTATGDNKAADAAYTCHVRCSKRNRGIQAIGICAR